MLGNVRGSSEELNVDARVVALNHMQMALQHLDSDETIPAIVGAHLQLAIDAFIEVTSGTRPSAT